MILYLKIFSIFLGSFLVLFASWIRIRILHAVPEGLSYCGSGSKSLFFLNRCKVTRIGSMVCRYPPGMYSCIAGFLDAGESLEECVRREAAEEVGVEVQKVSRRSKDIFFVFLTNLFIHGTF